MRRPRLIKVFWFLIPFLAPTGAFAEVPAWLRLATSTPVQVYAKDVPAVVLLNERMDTVEPNGRVTSQVRFAVKILTAAGKDLAIARAMYTTDTAEVKELRAWMIRPAGVTKEYEKKDTLDLALLDDDVYNEVRVRSIVGSSEAEPGAIFGYEAETQDRSVFTQIDWSFQTRLPAATARYIVNVSEGWRAESLTFNYQTIVPTVAGSAYTWELRNLPYIRDEEAQPSLSQLAPRLAVNVYPPARTNPGIARTFSSWSDVSQWMTDLNDLASVPDETVIRKTRELTSGVTNVLDKIAAIGEYVQSIQYISIQTGLGRGGGYRPHPAPQVLAKSYGDCKDKANLMRSMLKTIGISSYAVSIYSGDPLYVRPEWPSPQQFNHAIVAIKVADEVDIGSTIVSPRLGRLLMFDPTDAETPIGDLPESLRDSFALVNAGRDGDLHRMPKVDSHLNRVVREIDATLAADGSIAAVIVEDSTGQRGVDERRSYRSMARPEWNRTIERWITRGVPGARVETIEATEEKRGSFRLRTQLVAPRYGQIMNNRLLVFRPTLVSRFQFALTAETRQSPLWLDSMSVEETSRFTLPSGFKVDELPDALHLQTTFGTYDVSYNVNGQELTCTRKRVLRSGLIAAADYASVRSFFKAVTDAEQAPVVLIRQ